MRLGVAATLVDGALVPGDVEIDDGVVARVELSSPNGRGIAAPGFVDLQVNGFAGVDFLHADAHGYAAAGEAILATGVTAFLPTFVSSAEERAEAALRELPVGPSAPRVLGAHLEGPFLAPGRLGAHDAGARRDPDPALLVRLLDSGPVRLVTLAPELPGALDLVGYLDERGIAVSCGHTDATVAQANAAFDRGARGVTHLFNAMRPFSHREVGIVGAALLRDDVVVQLVADGIHVSWEAVHLVSVLAHGRVALVTDAVAATAAPDGTYELGDAVIERQDGVVRGPGGVLAGSTLTMDEAVRNLHATGVPLAAAIAAASAAPARLLGDPTLGRLAPGTPADIVVLDDRLEVARVICAGVVVVG